MDTLKKDRYHRLSKVNGFNLAYEGLLEAIDCKFDRVKLNCVLMNEFNEDEIIDFVGLAQKYPIEVRFIEFMPFEGNKWASNKLINYRDALHLIKEKFPTLRQLEPKFLNEVSKVYEADDMLGTIGFISSMSDNFCSGCNRLRITADGNLKVCLFGNEETSLRDLMRNGATDTEIVRAVEVSLYGKKRQHAGKCHILDSMGDFSRLQWVKN